MKLLINIIKRYGFVMLWVTVIALMSRDWLSDPFDTHSLGDAGTDSYGHNGENALIQGILFTFVELLLIMARLDYLSVNCS